MGYELCYLCHGMLCQVVWGTTTQPALITVCFNVIIKYQKSDGMNDMEYQPGFKYSRDWDCDGPVPVYVPVYQCTSVPGMNGIWYIAIPIAIPVLEQVVVLAKYKIDDQTPRTYSSTCMAKLLHVNT